jgi:DNA-binding transcriptional MerR regulator
VSSRTYLSIGDVLTLLREEFPDVTISKIRFLESQGLVNPERSPSGYRKFFEHDVERLRWVLRQQREHFLPLKVIRDRLAEGDLDDVPAGTVAVATESAPGAEAEESAQSNGRMAEHAHAEVGVGGGNGAATVGRHSIGSTSSGSRDDEPLTKADSEAMARILADASRRAAQLPDTPRETVRTAETTPGPAPTPITHAPQPAPAAATRQAPPPAAVPSRATSTQTQPPTTTARPTGQPSDVEAGRRSGKGVDVVAEAVASAAKRGESGSSGSQKAAGAPAAGAAGRSSGASGGQAASGKGGGTTPSGGRAGTPAMVTGVSLSVDELCSASGLSVTELASLEGFGLIQCVVVAGMPAYDEDALTVANLAAELRVFGIEPRHLRLYKNAVDREVGLIEQVIIPLLRQRNPESRQRALDSAEQLGTLGQTMRATLLRSALRRHLGG